MFKECLTYLDETCLHVKAFLKESSKKEAKEKNYKDTNQHVKREKKL